MPLPLLSLWVTASLKYWLGFRSRPSSHQPVFLSLAPALSFFLTAHLGCWGVSRETPVHHQEKLGVGIEQRALVSCPKPDLPPPTS